MEAQVAAAVDASHGRHAGTPDSGCDSSNSSSTQRAAEVHFRSTRETRPAAPRYEYGICTYAVDKINRSKRAKGEGEGEGEGKPAARA